MNRVNVLGVDIDNLTLNEAVDKALSLINEHRCAYMITPNPEIVMAAWDDPKVGKAIENADLVIPDGVGVMQAARILKTPVPQPMSKTSVSEKFMFSISLIISCVVSCEAVPNAKCGSMMMSMSKSPMFF